MTRLADMPGQADSRGTPETQQGSRGQRQARTVTHAGVERTSILCWETLRGRREGQPLTLANQLLATHLHCRQASCEAEALRLRGIGGAVVRLLTRAAGGRHTRGVQSARSRLCASKRRATRGVYGACVWWWCQCLFASFCDKRARVPMACAGDRKTLYA